MSEVSLDSVDTITEAFEVDKVVVQEEKTKDKVVPYYSETRSVGNLDHFMNSTLGSQPMSPVSQSKVTVEAQGSKKGGNWWNPIDWAVDFWDWLTGAEEIEENIPLSEEQKNEITKIFKKASAITSKHLEQGDEAEVEEVLSLTKALVDVYKEIYDLRDVAIRTQADSYGKKKALVDAKREELNKKRDKLMKKLETKTLWSNLVAAAGPIGLAFAGASALSGMWAFVAVGSGALLALEQFSGGKAKEAIAKHIAGDDTIKQQNVEYYLSMATSVLCLGASIVATQGTNIVRMAATLTQVPVMIGEGQAQRDADLAMSGENTSKHQYKKAVDKLAGEGKKPNKYEEDFGGKVKKLIDIINNDSDMAIGLMRE